MFGGFVLIVLRRVADPTYSPAPTVEDEDEGAFDEVFFINGRAQGMLR